MVEVELAVPAVVDGVAEVHELRRRADVELQPLKMVMMSVPSYFSAFCMRRVYSGLEPAHSSIAICSISGRPKAWMHQAIPDRSINWPMRRSSGTRTASSSRDNRASGFAVRSHAKHSWLNVIKSTM